jgi:parvulin-like peptidyl-prolyl isomerase
LKRLRRRRLPAVICCGVLLALAASTFAACEKPGAGPSPTSAGHTVVVRVDGEAVTRADVDAVRAELRFAGVEDDEQAARAQAIRRLLVRREAGRLGVTVSQKAVDERLAGITAGAGGEEALAAALENAAMTREQFVAAARHALLEIALAAKLFTDEKPIDAEVVAFYREQREGLFTRPAAVRLRKITVPSEAMATRAATEADGGLAFAAAARRYSMDEKTRYEGGMLGWILVDSLPQEVASALAGLSAKEVSSPIHSFGRWHLYQVVDRRDERAVPLAEVRDEIRRELTRRRRANALDAWVRSQLEEATVDTSP